MHSYIRYVMWHLKIQILLQQSFNSVSFPSLHKNPFVPDLDSVNHQFSFSLQKKKMPSLKVHIPTVVCICTYCYAIENGVDWQDISTFEIYLKVDVSLCSHHHNLNRISPSTVSKERRYSVLCSFYLYVYPNHQHLLLIIYLLIILSLFFILSYYVPWTSTWFLFIFLLFNQELECSLLFFLFLYSLIYLLFTLQFRIYTVCQKRWVLDIYVKQS